jgi:hypothetical protein
MSPRVLEENVEVHELRLVWTDPRTGTEYEITGRDVGQEESVRFSAAYLVRNRLTGEQASFPYKRPEDLQEFLTGLVDAAEAYVSQRTKKGGVFRRWGVGARAVGVAVKRATNRRWRKQA